MSPRLAVKLLKTSPRRGQPIVLTDEEGVHNVCVVLQQNLSFTLIVFVQEAGVSPCECVLIKITGKEEKPFLGHLGRDDLIKPDQMSVRPSVNNFSFRY